MGNITNAGDLADTVEQGGGFGRAYGFDPSRGVAAFAGLRGTGALRSTEEARRLGLTIAEGIARAGVFGNGNWRDCFSDGTNLRTGPSDSQNQWLRGAPRAVTPSSLAATTEVVTAEWVRSLLTGQALYSTGDFKLTLKTAPDTGWLFLNGQTIGAAASGATGRANADTEALFTLLWNSLADAQAPVTPGGRGASAAADFAANKRIALPDARGRALVGAGQGAGLTNRVLAGTFGAETHALSLDELAAHSHGGTTGAAGAHSHTGTTGAAGAHIHTAETGAAGTHSHSGTTDDQGLHSHMIDPARQSRANWNDNGDGGISNGAATTAPAISPFPTEPAGVHWHNLNLSAAGHHDHAVTVNPAPDHNHGVTIAAAADHSHTIAAAGQGTAHPNVQPSIAFNVMVKL